MSLAALILASGASRRLGQAKQAFQVEGEALLHRAARAALEAGFDPVRVVLGAHRETLAPLVADLSLEVMDNPDWETGMASSIRRGLEALPAEVTGVLLLVCDQVRLDADILRRLRDAHGVAADRPAACWYEGIAGVPALFPRRLFADLAALVGDQGARRLLRGRPCSKVPWPDGAKDLDWPGDALP